VDDLILPGDHVTMFDPENVQPLVEKLRQALSENVLKSSQLVAT